MNQAVPRIISSIINVLGEPKKARGDEWAWCCPFCIERGQKRLDTRYRLSVNPFKRESHGIASKSGFVNCFNCGFKGTTDFMLRKLGLEIQENASTWVSVLEALQSLCVPEAAPETVNDADMLCDFPCEVWQINPGLESYKYLVDQRGIAPEAIRSLGLRVGSKRYNGRVFFPNFDEEGRMNFWVARAFTPEFYGPKYLSAPGLPRKFRIYRYYQVLSALRKQDIDSVIITEGAISAIRAGPEGVAAYGKYVSPEQIDMLAKMQGLVGHSIRYLVALDGDAVSFSNRLAMALYERGLDTYLVNLPPEHDPASMSPDKWKALKDNPVPYTGIFSEAISMVSNIKYRETEDEESHARR